MRKIVASLLVLVMLFSLVACASNDQTTTTTTTTTAGQDETTTTETTDPENDKVQVNGMLWAVEPLPERTTITYGYVAQSSPQLAIYAADKMGWFDAVNIDIEYIYFVNGPAQMEAVTAGAWDVGTTGIGGIITGILGHNIKVLGVAARDEGLFQAFFARRDSDIVQDGTGHASVPEVYGTPDSWRGKDILTAIGTTNHYALYHTLLSLGLTFDDVNAINMDVASASTAFKAGEGDVVGVWGSLLYDEAFSGEDSEYVLVSSDKWLGSGLVTNYVASPRFMSDNEAAVEKWLELAFMGAQWCKDNLEEAAELFVEFDEGDGYTTAFETAYAIISENPYATLEENHGYYTTVEDGHPVAENQIRTPMAGFVAMGNYTQDQFDQLFAGDNFIGDPVISIYNRVKSE